MEGEQIPKATMNNYLKLKLKSNFNSDFANRILLLAKCKYLSLFRICSQNYGGSQLIMYKKLKKDY